ncbi:Dephospho-CoA kinase [bioreactor metagenome]|uniref:Dephospho-CoA kinase n=1 Tax=bioreactor metagenome TaxID=1076179 RepID=A0A645F860_9ZZZZ
MALAERDFQEKAYRVAVFEVPLLFESGMDSAMDFCVMVSCDQETRVQRVMERDGLLREQVEARIRAQMPEEEKRLRADYLLDNNGSEAEFLVQVDALYQKLTAEGQHN